MDSSQSQSFEVTFLSGRSVRVDWPRQSLQHLSTAVLHAALEAGILDEESAGVETEVELVEPDGKKMTALPDTCPTSLRGVFKQGCFYRYLYEDLLGDEPDYGGGKYWTDGTSVCRKVEADGSVKYYPEDD
jgi:hypothetical protein